MNKLKYYKGISVGMMLALLPAFVRNVYEFTFENGVRNWPLIVIWMLSFMINILISEKIERAERYER